MRISRNAFTNLAASMVGFGVLIGLSFPFAVLLVGVPSATALSPLFFAFTISAGILVGGINILLARYLVRPKLRLMARYMHEVEEGIRHATYTGDWSECDADQCALPEDSEDEFTEAAAAFNSLLRALSESHTVEARITDFTTAMSAELDVQAICQSAIDCFRRDLGATGVAIIGGLAGGLDVLASHGLTDPSALIETDLVRSAIRSMRADSMSMPEHLVIDAAVAHLRPQHVIVYPLVLESTAIGAVVLASSGEVPRSAQALGPLFIRTLSVALSNALSHESMRRIAAVDGLTGLLNRREGLRRLERDYLHALHAGKPIGVIMVDIDHFKQVNDTHGHLAGDAVLREVASAAAEVLRGDDYLVRYGGEEFLAVLPGAGSAQIGEIAERVRTGATENATVVDGIEVAVTVSAGYATTDDVTVGDAMTLVGRADEALLMAKRTGRNRSISALALTA